MFHEGECMEQQVRSTIPQAAETVLDQSTHEVAQPQVTRQQLFDQMSLVAQAIAQTLGPRCEAVVYDLDAPEHKIAAISGDVTGRKVGGPMTEFTLRVLQSRVPGDEILTVESRSPQGRRIKSSSVVFREPDGRIFGALCINLDIEVMSQAADLLAELSQIPEPKKPPAEHVSAEPAELIAEMFREELSKRGLILETLKRDERIAIVQALRDEGVFNFKNASTIVADLLGVSRFTIYNYLNKNGLGTANARYSSES